jgi:hypothetical protein
MVSNHSTLGSHPPLKSEFEQQLMEEVNALRMEMTEGQRTRADDLRCQMVAPFLINFHKVTTAGNFYSAFETTGLVPLSPTRPLESPFVAAAPAGVFDGIVRRRNGVSAELLTDFDSIQRLFAEQNGRTMTDQDFWQIDVDTIWSGLMISEQETPLQISLDKFCDVICIITLVAKITKFEKVGKGNWWLGDIGTRDAAVGQP